MEIAFAAAAAASCIYRAYTEDRRWLAAPLAALVGMAAILALFGRNIFSETAMFSGGCLNLVVTPAPHTLTLVLALVFAVPIGLAGALRRDTKNRAMLISLAVFSVALMPGAMGRCDSGHVFWYACPLFLLSCLLAQGFTRRLRTLWFVWLAVVGTWAFAIDMRLSVTPLLRLARDGTDAAFGRDSGANREITKVLGTISDAAAGRFNEEPAARSIGAGDLTGVIGAGAQVATPFTVDKMTRKMLENTRAYVPEYFPDLECPWDARTEGIKARELRKAEWALVPQDFEPSGENLGFQQVIFQFPVTCKQVRDPILFGSIVLEELETHWTRQGALGSYWIYRNTGWNGHGEQAFVHQVRPRPTKTQMP
jgi:hypothetical protein